MQIIGFTRDETVLSAIVLRPVTAPFVPGPGDLCGPYCRLEFVPLRELPAGSDHDRKLAAQLLRDWAALARVEALDAAVLVRVMRILLETRSSAAGTRGRLPPLDPGEEKRAFRPTAAHPRAYRGTKDRPPKARLPRPYDLRKWLASSEGVNLLLRRLSHHWPRVRAILSKAGYDPDRLSRIDFPPRGVLDPWWDYDLGGPRPELSARFSTCFLPLLRGKSIPFLRQTLGAFRDLDLQNDSDLLAHLLAILTGAGGEEEFLHACRLLLGRTPVRRSALAPLLARSPQVLRGAARVTEEEIQRIERVSPEEFYPHRLACFIEAAAFDLPRDYLLEGFRLASSFEPEFDFTFRCFQTSAGFDAAVVEDLVLRLEGREDLAMRLWDKCGTIPGLVGLLRDLDWAAMPPELSAEFLDMLLYLRQERLPPKKLAGAWKLLLEAAPLLHAEVLKLSEGYREKFLECLKDLHWYWRKPGVDRMARALPSLHRLAARISRPPFSRDSRPGTLLCHLACCAGPEDLVRLETLPDSTFMKLEEAYDRWNDREALGDGFFALSHQLRRSILEWLDRCPAALIRVARSLGLLSEARRDEVITRFKDHPLRAVRWESVSPPGALKALEPFLRKGLTSPMPRKLRDHLQGRITLTPQQEARCLRVLREQVPATLLEVLDSLTGEALAEGVTPKEPKTERERHALGMLRNVESNGRALRRFLKAHFRGEGDFIGRHPNTRRWFARHPRIDEAVWRGGVTLEREVAGHGPVRISVERDPLEALKLGTYAGSCLGLGGENAHSAAAVILDVNKQVLYARDRKGTVLGRQLVAISEEEELVCFGIYPWSAPASLRRFFREYDEEFAARLGLPLHRARGTPGEGALGNYEIARIISSDWYDDGPWDYRWKGAKAGAGPASVRA